MAMSIILIQTYDRYMEDAQRPRCPGENSLVGSISTSRHCERSAAICPWHATDRLPRSLMLPRNDGWGMVFYSNRSSYT
jgi:hypothetical protein